MGSRQPAVSNPLDAVGLSGPAFTMPLELGKLREFARATDAPADPYLNGDRPPVTPTFLTTARLWEADSPWQRVGLEASRILHAEQEYRFHGPPPQVGTELIGRSTIENVYTKEGRRGRMTFAVMVTEFRDESGRIVAEARMTGVEMPPPGGLSSGKPSSESRPSAPVAGSATESAKPSQATVPATALPTTPVIATKPEPRSHGPLTITDFVRYQGASGDMNPLHHDPAQAQLAGFTGPISVGMLQAGLLASYAVRWLGAEQIRRFRVRFQKPVMLGDRIACQAAEPLQVGDGSVEAHIICARQNGEPAAEAWAEFAAG